jgi:hypothetical protein
LKLAFEKMMLEQVAVEDAMAERRRCGRRNPAALQLDPMTLRLALPWLVNQPGQRQRHPLFSRSNCMVSLSVRLQRLRYRQAFWAWVFLSPGLVYFAIFLILPVLASVYISFTNWDILTPPVGSEWRTTRNCCKTARSREPF